MEEKEGWRREADEGVKGGREDGVKGEVGGRGGGGRNKGAEEENR